MFGGKGRRRLSGVLWSSRNLPSLAFKRLPGFRLNGRLDRGLHGGAR